MASQSEEPTSANNANFAIALLFSLDNVDYSVLRQRPDIRVPVPALRKLTNRSAGGVSKLPMNTGIHASHT
jgi:hypothetical protein